MRAAVSTVCSSLASKPLYKPRKPWVLKQPEQFYINDHSQIMFGVSVCGSVNSLDPLHEQEKNSREASHQTALAVPFVLTELMKKQAGGYLTEIFKFNNPHLQNTKTLPGFYINTLQCIYSFDLFLISFTDNTNKRSFISLWSEIFTLRMAWTVWSGYVAVVAMALATAPMRKIFAEDICGRR